MSARTAPVMTAMMRQSVSRRALTHADPEVRPWLLDAWANAEGGKDNADSTREALALYREVLHLKPDYGVVYSNIMERFTRLGDEEGALREGV